MVHLEQWKQGPTVSAGIRGTQILLAPADYLRATGATLGAIAMY